MTTCSMRRLTPISVSVKTTTVTNEQINISPESITCISNSLSYWTLQATVSHLVAGQQ